MRIRAKDSWKNSGESNDKADVLAASKMDGQVPAAISGSDSVYEGNEVAFSKETLYNDSGVRAFSEDSLEESEKPATSINSSFWRRRFKWILLACILFAGLLVGLLFAFLPNIAQLFMNGSKIKFDQMKIMEPTESGFRTIILGEITNAGPFDAETKPMKMQVYYANDLIGSINMPGIQLVGGKGKIQAEGNFSITNSTRFEAFSKELMLEKEVEWKLVAQMDLNVMGSISLEKLEFDKDVSITGMHRFEGVTVETFELNGDENSINVTLTTSLDNKSPVSIQMGDIFFDMFYKDGYLGQVGSLNTTIEAGKNTLKMNGTLVPPRGNESSEHFSQMFSDYVSGRTAQIKVVGLNELKSGRRPRWLNGAFTSLDMQVALEGDSDLKMINDIQLNGMSLNFGSLRNSTPEIAVKNVTVDFKMPFDFPIEITSTKMEFDILNDGKPFGKVITGYVPALNPDPQTIIMSLPTSQIDLFNSPVFSSMIEDVFKFKEKSYGIKGYASVFAQTPVGNFPIKGIGFTQTVTTRGMQELRPVGDLNATSNPVIHSTDIVEGTKNSIKMINDISMYSSTDMTVNMGNVMLDLIASGEKIGYSEITNLTLAPGENRFFCESFFRPISDNEKEVGKQLMTNFLNRQVTNITMKGTKSSTSNPLLAKTLELIDLQAPLSGLEEKLVQSSSMRFGFMTAISGNSQTSFIVLNPFGANMFLSRIEANISRLGEEIATMNATTSNGLPLADLPARAITETDLLPLEILNPLSSNSFGALRRGVTNNLAVSVRSRILGKLGLYPLDLEYVDDELPTGVTLF